MTGAPLAQMAALVAGLSAVTLMQRWHFKGENDVLALAMLAAGAMLTMAG